MNTTHIDLVTNNRLHCIGMQGHGPGEKNHVFIDLDAGNDTRVVCPLSFVRPYNESFNGIKIT